MLPQGTAHKPVDGDSVRRCPHLFVGGSLTLGAGANPPGRGFEPRLNSRSCDQAWRSEPLVRSSLDDATKARLNGPRWRFQERVQKGSGSNAVVAVFCPPYATMCKNVGPHVARCKAYGATEWFHPLVRPVRGQGRRLRPHSFRPDLFAQHQPPKRCIGPRGTLRRQFC